MHAEELEKEVIDELTSMGFTTVRINGIRSVPKLIAQKNAQKLVIKIVVNIDSVNEKDATTLYKIAEFLDASPVIIGNKSQNGELKQGVRYTRFSIECISNESLDTYIYTPNKYFASKNVGIKRAVDSYRLRRLRQIKGLTLKDLASTLHISKSTLYKYEHHSVFASDKILQKLENFFGESLGAEAPQETTIVKIPGERKLGKSEVRSIELNSAPFYLIAKGRNYYPAAGEADARTLVKYVKFFEELMENFSNTYPFFVGHRQEKIGRVSMITEKQLNELSSEDELLEMI